MNLIDVIAGFTGMQAREDNIFDPNRTHDVSIEPANRLAVFTCCKILSDNFSRLPLTVKRDGIEVNGHRLAKIFNGKPNGFMNRQQILSFAEWQRNDSGNSFLEIRGNNLIPINAHRIIDYEVTTDGRLRYQIMSEADPRLKANYFKDARWIDSRDILHFKHTGFIMGMSPLSAAAATTKLLQNASDTVNAFYRNRAVIPLALESTAAQPKDYAMIMDDRKQFESIYQGAIKSGKTAILPVNSKLTPLAVHFADAELIATMKFSRDEICTMYQIPNFMLNEMEASQTIEDVTLLFKQTTLAPIANIYANEIAFKMLTDEEIESGHTVSFDFDVMLEVDFASKVGAFSQAVTTGLMSPNAAGKHFGGSGIKEKWGDYHFMQAQYLPLEMFDKFNSLLKDSPNVDKATSDNNFKNE